MLSSGLCCTVVERGLSSQTMCYINSFDILALFLYFCVIELEAWIVQRMFLVVILSVVPIQAFASPANDYGLYQTQVGDVLVTRGKAFEPERVFPSEVKRTPKTVNLSRDYRGTVFGKHRVIREGVVLYRSALLPIHRSEGD